MKDWRSVRNRDSRSSKKHDEPAEDTREVWTGWRGYYHDGFASIGERLDGACERDGHRLRVDEIN